MKKIFLLLALCLALASCGTTKKNIDKGQSDKELIENTTKDSTTTKQEEIKTETKVKENETTDKKEETVTVKKDQTIEAEGDGSGEITVTEKDNGDGTKDVSATGVDRLIIRDVNTVETETIEELTEKTKVQEKTITELRSEVTTLNETVDRLEKQFEEWTKRDIERTGPSLLQYIGGGSILLLLIIIAVVIWYFRRKIKQAKSIASLPGSFLSG